MSVNIVEVIHDRISKQIDAGTVGVTLNLETEDETQADKLIQHLKEKDIEFKILA